MDMQQPPITISHLDAQRIEALLQKAPPSKIIALLEDELARARLVTAQEIPPDVVTMNSRVRCKENQSGREYCLTLVYPKDATGEGRVSVLAPVGAALIGLSVGQSIDWPGPGGKLLQLTILAIEYQPEAAGEHNR